MTLFELVTEAVRDISEHGFTDMERVQGWMDRIRAKALEGMMPERELQELLRKTLESTFQSQIGRGLILQHHAGVSRFTLQRVEPKLRDALDKRIMASANLIKLNREAAIQRTMQRFSGWATSIPEGGSDQVDKVHEKMEIRKALTQLPFVERRVAIDQGHKFVASLSTILAENAGAIAGRWHSHWRQPGYQFRKDHKERDPAPAPGRGHVFAVRGNWAIERGFMTTGAGYTDSITQPAEEPFCRCFYTWFYGLRQLPDDMLTATGRAELERVKLEMAR